MFLPHWIKSLIIKCHAELHCEHSANITPAEREHVNMLPIFSSRWFDKMWGFFFYISGTAISIVKQPSELLPDSIQNIVT